MITALIVIGVIVFLVVDAYILMRVFGSRKSAGDFGALPVPGETTVTLPAGKVKLTYQETRQARTSANGTIDFGVHPGLQVTIASAAGQALEIKGPGWGGMGAELSTGSGWSRAVVGSVEIDQPGVYMVTATGELEGAVVPQVLIGT